MDTHRSTHATVRVSARARALRLGLLALLTAGLACASAKPPPASPAAGPYRVGAPDSLHITVLPEPVIERTAVVRPDGMISIDLVGDVPAAGRTPEEIAADIEQRIGKFKRGARVTVSVTAAQSSSVTILGEVLRPASFPMTKETRVIEAIGFVGGPTRFAAQSRTRIVRSAGGQAQVISVNLSAIQGGDLRTNYRLEQGDPQHRREHQHHRDHRRRPVVSRVTHPRAPGTDPPLSRPRGPAPDRARGGHRV
jgi:polysaccharide export outer membrane protein